MSQEDTPQGDGQKFSEKVKEKAAQVRQHVKDNRTTYLVGAGCLIVGLHYRRPIVIDFKPVINNMPTFNNHVENNLGRVSKIVRDVVTGQEWMKIRYLAEEIAKEREISVDAARVMLRRHFLGELPNVFGKTYEIAGLRTDF